MNLGLVATVPLAVRLSNHKARSSYNPKFVPSSQKYGFRIRDPEKTHPDPDPGFKNLGIQGSKSTGSRILDPNFSLTFLSLEEYTV